VIDIKFRLDMQPRPSNKRRAALVGGHARVVQDKAVVAHQGNIAAMSSVHRPLGADGRPLVIDEPIELVIDAVMPRPAGLCKRSSRTGQPLVDPGRRWHTQRPDIDNLQKSVLDGMKDWWSDDKIVASVQVRKLVAALDEAPGYHVHVRSAAALEEGRPGWERQDLDDEESWEHKGGGWVVCNDGGQWNGYVRDEERCLDRYVGTFASKTTAMRAVDGVA
jgi:Holliday junction resolvase RusA-like endonuclease